MNCSRKVRSKRVFHDKKQSTILCVRFTEQILLNQQLAVKQAIESMLVRECLDLGHYSNQNDGK